MSLPKLVEHPDKEIRLRQKNLYEMVYTEKEYVDDVGVIVDVRYSVWRGVRNGDPKIELGTAKEESNAHELYT